MPTLANVDGRSLVADTSSISNAIGAIFGTPKSREADRQKKLDKADTEDALDILGDKNAPEDEKQKSLMRLMSINPAMGKAVKEVKDTGDLNAIEEVRRENLKGLQEATAVLAQPDHEKRINMLHEMRKRNVVEGKPNDRLNELMNKSPEELKIALQVMQISGKNAEQTLKPDTELNKIDQEKFTAESFKAYSKSKDRGDLVPIPKGINPQIMSAVIPMIMGGVDFDDPSAVARAMDMTSLVSSAMSGASPEAVAKIQDRLKANPPPKPVKKDESQSLVSQGMDALKEGYDWARSLFPKGTPERKILEAEIKKKDGEVKSIPRERMKKSVPDALIDEKGFYYKPNPAAPNGRQYILDKKGGSKIKAE